MRLIFVLIISVSFTSFGFSQCKKFDVLDKLFEKQQYQKAVDKAVNIAKKEKYEAYPYYFLTKLYFYRYQKENQLLYLTSALNSAFRAQNRDKEKACLKDFESVLSNLRKVSEQLADSLYEHEEKDNAVVYFELILKIYGDTTQNYASILNAEPELITNNLSATNTQAYRDLVKISKEELENLNQVNADGVKIGRWIKFYENGQAAYNVFFKNGKPYGDYYRYHENGARKAYLHYSENKLASVTLYNEDTSIIANGFYNGSKKDSTWIYYYKNGLKSAEINYNLGLENGRAKVFFPDGNLLEELDWKNGVKEGIWRQFYPSNKKRLEARYVNNEKNGSFFMYFENGAYDAKGKYLNGLRHGQWDIYDKSNRIIDSKLYTNGKLPIEVKLDSLKNELNVQTALFNQAKRKNKSVEEIRLLNAKIIALKKEIVELQMQSPEELENIDLKFIDEAQPASADPMNYINNPQEYIRNNR